MKKFISVVSASILMFSSVTAMDLTNSPINAEDDTIKIMCIGDSITDGYTYEYVGSYRKFIYHNLTEEGYNIDMVGSKGDGWTPTYIDSETGESFEFDNDNTGYSGYSIINYSGRSGIYETLQSTGCLTSEAPDIVTLQIGTNDVIDNYEMEKAGERLEILVDYILENIPDDSVLFISPIPQLDPNKSDVYDWFGNYRHSADWSEQYDDITAEDWVRKSVASYNTFVNEIVTQKQQEGKNVVFSEAAFEITDVKTQLFDGVHPNNTGYKAMGDYWSDIIDSYLSGSEVIPPVSEITTTTTDEITTTTTETTTVTTQTTAPDYIIDFNTTTATDSEKEDVNVKISNLVRLSRYVINSYGYEFTEDEIESFDVNKDGRADVFDVILMRQSLIDAGKKLREKFGDDYCLFENGEDIVIIDSSIDETTKITSGNSSSSAVIKSDFSEPTDITDWYD
ncbi:MAG: hypothetical protein K2O36_06555, partial [Ruminococcus sp.]|nr:hypothetical protein [Ruminococcus sp.]